MFLLIVKQNIPALRVLKRSLGFWESRNSGGVWILLVLCLKLNLFNNLSLQPIQIISSTIEMVKPGKLPSGKTEIPFEFPLQMKGNKVLYETYHGVFVNIQVRRSCLHRKLGISSPQCHLKQL